MEVKDTATICISTPRGPDNFYSELTDVRDERGRLGRQLSNHNNQRP